MYSQHLNHDRPGRLLPALFADNGAAAVAAWADGLGGDDLESMVNDLYMPVVVLERTELPPVARFTRLEALIRPFPVIQEALAGIPHTERRRLAFGLGLLISGLIANYRRVLEGHSRLGRLSRLIHGRVWTTAKQRLAALASAQAWLQQTLA